MENTTLKEVTQVISDLGTIGVLIIVVWAVIFGGLKRKWIFGWIYEERKNEWVAREDAIVSFYKVQLSEIKAQRDKFESIALQAMNIGEELVNKGNP